MGCLILRAVWVSVVGHAQGMRGLDSVLPSAVYGTACFLLSLFSLLRGQSSASLVAELS